VQAFAPVRFRRDVTRVQRALQEAEVVGTLEDLAAGRQPVARAGAHAATAAELQLTAARVAELFAATGSAR